MKRNNHYIPKFYLRHFAIEKRKKIYMTGVIDKIEDRRFEKEISYLAFERNFHIIKVDGEDTDMFEDLHNILYEKPIHVKYNKIIAKYEKIIPLPYPNTLEQSIKNSKSKEVISSEDKEVLAYFIAYLFIRGKRIRCGIDDFFKQMRTIYTELYRVNTQLSQAEIEEKVNEELGNEEAAKKAHISSMFDENLKVTLSKIIKDHIWYLGINNTPYDIYTSDVGYGMTVTDKRYPQNRGIGFASRSLEFIIPLTPKIYLCINERSYNEEAVKGPYSILENKAIEIGKEQIMRVNDMIISFADRKILSKNNNWEIYDELKMYSEKENKV